MSFCILRFHRFICEHVRAFNTTIRPWHLVGGVAESVEKWREFACKDDRSSTELTELMKFANVKHDSVMREKCFL